MKVIFLDIDGVLNSEKYFIDNHESIKLFYKDNIYNKNNVELLVKRQLMDIDCEKLFLLKEIINETDAKVVIISTWKKLFIFPQIVVKLNEIGIPVVGFTTDSVVDRGAGIKKYIREHAISKYAILDDDIFDDYDDEIISKLVKTSFYNGGLQEDDCKKLIRILNKK